MELPAPLKPVQPEFYCFYTPEGGKNRTKSEKKFVSIRREIETALKTTQQTIENILTISKPIHAFSYFLPSLNSTRRAYLNHSLTFYTYNRKKIGVNWQIVPHKEDIKYQSPQKSKNKYENLCR